MLWIFTLEAFAANAVGELSDQELETGVYATGK